MKTYTTRWSGETHAAHPRLLFASGLMLDMALIALLVVSMGPDVWPIGFSLYFASIITLYGASTSGLRTHFRSVNELLDASEYGSVFWLLAAVYSPFALIMGDGVIGIAVFTLGWGLAITGMWLKSELSGRYRMIYLLVFAGMVWAATVLAGVVFAHQGLFAFAWLSLGGVCFVLATLADMLRGLPFHHRIWHAFILAGAVVHLMFFLCVALPESFCIV